MHTHNNNTHITEKVTRLKSKERYRVKNQSKSSLSQCHLTLRQASTHDWHNTTQGLTQCINTHVYCEPVNRSAHHSCSYRYNMCSSLNTQVYCSHVQVLVESFWELIHVSLTGLSFSIAGHGSLRHLPHGCVHNWTWYMLILTAVAAMATLLSSFLLFLLLVWFYLWFLWSKIVRLLYTCIADGNLK